MAIIWAQAVLIPQSFSCPNLGWKLAHVLTGRSGPSLLHTYSAERQLEAKRLVETDRKWARIMSAPLGEAELDGSEMPRFQKQFIENLEFTGGLAVKYDPSPILGGQAHQHLATVQVVGKRLHSAPVLRLADAKPMQLGHVAQADGRWRLYAFAGRDDDGTNGGAISRLCSFLQDDPASTVTRYTRPGEDIDALIDLRAVFQQDFRSLRFEQMPGLLRPAKRRYGLRDYEKVFCVDHKSGQDIYEMRGIDRTLGCLVTVRPDQYVAQVLPLDDHAALAASFDGFLKPA